VLLEIAAKYPNNKVSKPLTKRRKAICTKEVKTQADYKLWIFEIKQLTIRFIDLICYRHSISAYMLGEFLTQEVEDNAQEELNPKGARAENKSFGDLKENIYDLKE
jgi:hypothetical protein